MKHKYYIVILLSLTVGFSLIATDVVYERAPRLDAPPVTSPISVVVPSLDLGAIQQALASINCKIGNVDQPVCDDTVLSILGDACSILGISISEALALLLECCETTTVDIQANFCSPIFIRQSDFDPSGQTPYVISSPGVYKLAEDITYNPIGAGTAAITINSSDVTLDLQCFMLQQGNATATTNGIVVNSGTNDFKIINGHIADFTNIAVTVSSNCSRFELRDFVCVNNGPSGIFLSGAAISEGLIDNIKVIGCSGALVNPFNLTGFFNIRVTNCSLNQNSSTGTLIGLNILSGESSLFENIEIHSNIAVGITGCLTSGSFCTFKDISVVDNISTANFVGFSVTGNNQEFYNCRALTNQATTDIIGFQTSGPGSSGNHLLSLCEVAANTTSGVGAIINAYLLLSSQFSTISDCIARRNSAPNANAALPNFGAIGFQVIASNYVLQNCLAEDQSAGAGSNDVGFWINNPLQVIVRDCQSYRQDFGFRLDPLNDINNTFLKNIAAENTTNYSQFPIGSTQSAVNISAINGSLTVPWTNVAIG